MKRFTATHGCDKRSMHISLVSRPNARRGCLDGTTGRITEVNTLSARFRAYSALDLNAALLERPLPTGKSLNGSRVGASDGGRARVSRDRYFSSTASLSAGWSEAFSSAC